MPLRSSSGKAGLILFLLFSLSLISLPSEAAKGKNLVISYQVVNKEKAKPSYCMVIWLEKPDGSYVKTLYASDWLAYGGYTVEGVCPLWVEKSDWANNADELPDAISGATPAPGPREMSFAWKKKELPQGSYVYHIEVHLTADYNEIYSGEIEFGKDGCESKAEVEYLPGKHDEIADVLSDVKVVFK